MHLFLTVCFLLLPPPPLLLTPHPVTDFKLFGFPLHSFFSATAYTRYKLLNKSYSLLQRFCFVLLPIAQSRTLSAELFTIYLFT